MTQKSAKSGPLRQWTLLRTLCASHDGVTVKDLAENVGASVKTIRRDLEVFQRAGFPLEEMIEDSCWPDGDAAMNDVQITCRSDRSRSIVRRILAMMLLSPLAGLFVAEARALADEAVWTVRMVENKREDRPERWKALNHAIAVNRLLGHKNRVAMTNRPAHSPTEQSNEQIYLFFEYSLKYPTDRR